MAEPVIVNKTREILANAHKNSLYEDSIQAEATDVYEHLQNQVGTVADSPEGRKLIQKYKMLAGTVSTEGTYLDMVKIIWRMVKSMSGPTEYRLLLFVIGVATVTSSLESSRDDVISSWARRLEVWLGKQLTIGGKGVTGDGDGSVLDRMQRFFSTPYLHDFD